MNPLLGSLTVKRNGTRGSVSVNLRRFSFSPILVMDVKRSAWNLVLLIFLVADFINIVPANRMLRNLNSKLNLMKTTFQRDIDELKYNVLDLSTELELERHRTSDLERLLNETLRTGYELSEPRDGTVGE